MALFVNIVFLGSALTIMLVYVWSRRNPFVRYVINRRMKKKKKLRFIFRMNFFGLLNFQAPYLPWVLFAFSLLLGNSIIVDLMGIIVGHIYYFLEDVFPRQQGGFRLLKTPRFLYVLKNKWFVRNFFFSRHWLFDEGSNRTNENDARPDLRNNEPFGAGGFDWQWSNILFICSISSFILIYFNTSLYISVLKEKKRHTYIYIDISVIACVQSEREEEEENESKMLIANFQRTCGHCYN